MSEEEPISGPMVKKATYLMHKLAEMHKKDFQDIQKRCRKSFDYTNLAKVSKSKGHKIIDKLIELTDGEETEEKAKNTDDNPRLANHSTTTDIDNIIADMTESMRASVKITMDEVVSKDVPTQGLGGFILEVGKIIFDAKREERKKQ